MKNVIFFAVAFVVTAPVIMGIATDSILFNVCAIIYGGLWYIFFTHTKVGRKALKKGYRIACKLMSSCDV